MSYYRGSENHEATEWLNQVEMTIKKDKESYGGRPARVYVLVDGLSVDFHILCSHRKVWMTYLDKGLYINAQFETMASCSPSWLRSQEMSSQKFLQYN